jgi:hypothetical protein
VEKPTVYVETSVVSYLAARRSRNVVLAGQQAVTRLWWQQREVFRLVTSGVAVREASAGDPAEAARRLRFLQAVDLPPFPADKAERLAALLTSRGALPDRAGDDAAHAAIAAILRADYLCSWNSKHLLNPATRPKVEQIRRDHGFSPATICTPRELIALVDAQAPEEPRSAIRFSKKSGGPKTPSPRSTATT